MRAFLAGGGWAVLVGGGLLGLVSVSVGPETPVVSQPPAATAQPAAVPAAPATAPVLDTPVITTPQVVLPDTAPAVPEIVPEPAPEIVPEIVPEPAPEPLPAIVPETVPELAPQTAADAPPLAAAIEAAAPPPAAMTPPAPEQDLPVATLPAPVPPALQDTPAEPLPAPQVRPQTSPSASLPQSTADVRVNRPRTAPAAGPEEPALDGDLASPLLRYAADFDYAADLPMIAVVLMDNALILDAPDVLSGLPFVPTIVLNAAAADVTARMRAYRAAGIEVLLQADLPQGALPSDVETTYVGAFGLVPEAIAIFSDGTGPEAQDRMLADQALRLIGDEGRGFVTLPRGMGGALRNITADGVPVAQITRDIDGAGETRDAIERSLQQAALRARQSGHVVLLGRTTPETLAAIRNWAERSDPSQISLAPVSAILLEQLAQ
ncbi:divergent polysaccharide deacetylase family protein [Yoonia sp. TsM2_T14_4]|uniref:divergent polysaccharide deacetylase family protein n=1 Tax=Yoonia sp. TsM2_T14_4 TaxID=3415141 RepID=UPI003C749091